MQNVPILHFVFLSLSGFKPVDNTQDNYRGRRCEEQAISNPLMLIFFGVVRTALFLF
jgi:hypothetical protein